MAQLTPLVVLILQCAGMAAGTFACGIVPLYLSLSKTKLRVLEVLGAGLLVGASMTVVLPEGVNALYDTSKSSEHVHHVRDLPIGPDGTLSRRTVREHVYDPESTVGMTLLAGFLVMFLIDQIASPGPHAHVVDNSHHHERDTDPSSRWNIRSHRTDAMRLTRASSLMVPKATDKSGNVDVNAVPTPSMTDSPDFSPADQDFPARLSSSAGNRSNGRDLAEGSSLLPQRQESTSSNFVRHNRGMRNAFASIAGLIIHAAADGIAMGASAGSGDESLKLVVLFAIMIHKAPASFGLCTLLMGQRLHKIDIRRAVAIFSIATPTGALATYAFLSLLTKNTPTSDDPISPHHIGAALTFSAGTFLFVAMHAVQELASATADLDMEEEHHHHRHHHRNHSAGDHHALHDQPAPKQILGRTGRIAVLVLGTILPKTMQMLVGHSH